MILGSRGGDLGGGLVGLPHKVSRHAEEDNVEDHDDGEGDDEEDDERQSAGEEAETNLRVAEARFE